MDAHTTSKPARIVRIIAVRDTRDVIEDGDRFVPVPGTGAIRACDRCGRDHEVHVDVELEDGRTSVIGLGCARGESMEVQAKIKSAASAAKTRAKLLADLAAARGQHMRAAIARREVEALELPAIELEVTAADSPLGAGRTIARMGAAVVWCLPGRTFDAERRQCLINAWRNDRYEERGFRMPVYALAQKVTELEGRIAKLDRKLAALCAA